MAKTGHKEEEICSFIWGDSSYLEQKEENFLSKGVVMQNGDPDGEQLPIQTKLQSSQKLTR